MIGRIFKRPDQSKLQTQITCIENEIEQRLLVYPWYIRQKRMTEDHAVKEITTMTMVLETLKGI